MNINRSLIFIIIVCFLLTTTSCQNKSFKSQPEILNTEKQPDILSSEEQPLVGIWRRSGVVYNDDNQEGTELIVLNTDRTWLQVAYLGKEEIPKEYFNIVRRPRWIYSGGHFRQYHFPPAGGGEHIQEGKIISVTPTIFSLENLRVPQGFTMYNRISGQTEIEIRSIIKELTQLHQ